MKRAASAAGDDITPQTVNQLPIWADSCCGNRTSSPIIRLAIAAMRLRQESRSATEPRRLNDEVQEVAYKTAWYI